MTEVVSQRVEEDDQAICCAGCFQDAGLAYNCVLCGVFTDDACPECGAFGEAKLTKDRLAHASYLFFVQGSTYRTNFGSAPLLEMNELNDGDELSDALNHDAAILRKHTDLRIFYYGPRLWMIGEIEPLKKLQDQKHRQAVVDEIVQRYPEYVFDAGESFFRIRVNPTKPETSDQYDAPPVEIAGGGRFCRPNKPVLYGSQDLEVCIHETRATIEDALYVATLQSLRNLRLLDLSAILPEQVTEFESLDHAVLFVFLAGNHAYEITRDIAASAEAAGFDGIIYPSYFSRVRSGAETIETVYGMSTRAFDKSREYEQSKVVRNFAIFGRPLEAGDVALKCINRATLTHITYGAILGPTGLQD